MPPRHATHVQENIVASRTSISLAQALQETKSHELPCILPRRLLCMQATRSFSVSSQWEVKPCHPEMGGGHVSTLEVAETWSHVPFWQACLLGFEIRDQYIQPCQVLWSDEGAEVVGLGLALARGDVESGIVSEMESIVRDGYCGCEFSWRGNDSYAISTVSRRSLSRKRRNKSREGHLRSPIVAPLAGTMDKSYKPRFKDTSHLPSALRKPIAKSRFVLPLAEPGTVAAPPARPAAQWSHKSFS